MAHEMVYPLFQLSRTGEEVIPSELTTSKEFIETDQSTSLIFISKWIKIWFQFDRNDHGNDKISVLPPKNKKSSGLIEKRR